MSFDASSSQPSTVAYGRRLFLLFFGCFGFYSTILNAGPVTRVGPNVPSDQRVPIDMISHKEWHVLLRAFVDDNGQVNYARWKNSGDANKVLEKYLSRLSTAEPRIAASKNGRLAFWINAYNALTIHGMLKLYPTSSIRNHTARVFGYNIWKDHQLLVGGKAYSLHAIEHEILRKMKDPRIHFGIVCASRGCPRLLNVAYTRANVDHRLTANTKAFLTQPANFRIDEKSNTVYLSTIFKWFSTDFGKNDKARLQWVSQFIATASAKQSLQGKQLSIAYLPYDWALNEQKR